MQFLETIFTPHSYMILSLQDKYILGIKDSYTQKLSYYQKNNI